MKAVLSMRRIAFWILFLTGVGFASEKPAYKEGESWGFRVKSTIAEVQGEYEVAFKDGKFESNDMQFLTSALYVTVHLDDPQKKWFEFPLVSGKKWSFQYQHRSAATGRLDRRNSEIEVVGPTPQVIKTPAGDFKVIELRRSDWFGGGRARFEITYFYSPETKSVVKLVADTDGPQGKTHSEMELIKYSTK
jgi:hypothetical protein